VCQCFTRLASTLDSRSGPRLALLFLGAVLARRWRTVTSWIRAAGPGDRFHSCYIAVGAAAKKADRIASRVSIEVVRPLVSGASRLTLALDDTPTRLYGPRVEGAGIHHNPALGPARSPYVHGHVIVVLAILATHRAWGVVALPLLSRFYVRRTDLNGVDAKHRPQFRAKLILAVSRRRAVTPPGNDDGGQILSFEPNVACTRRMVRCPVWCRGCSRS
jgi:hypothetical protein